jgi:DDE superfamily endonuclease
MPACQETCRAQLQRVLPPAHTRPGRACSQDDSRCGWLTVRRRRLTACGGQPVGPVQHVLEGLSGWGAGAPTPGERCFLELPSLNTESVPLVVDTLAQAFPASLKLLRPDHSGIHRAQRRRLPTSGRLVFCPPDGPELNPIERLWRALKDDWAWQQLISVEVPPDDVSRLLQAYDALTLPARTGNMSSRWT